MSNAGLRTIEHFGEQWTRYPDNDGWYGSLGLLHDILSPLVDPASLTHTTVAEIGSGAGRIVGMLLAAGVDRVFAIEPSPDACAVLARNVAQSTARDRVTILNARGDDWRADRPLDAIVSIGVIHHIPDPAPVIARAFEQLKPGGRLFVWLYGQEGNGLYLAIVRPVRAVTTRVPHAALAAIVWLAYGALAVYRLASLVAPLPLRSYLRTVLWPMTPDKRRLVIYDQLNPAYAKYYTEAEARALLASAGFADVRTHHRHGYSWSVIGVKPLAGAHGAADGERAAAAQPR